MEGTIVLDPRRKDVLGMTDIAILMGACPAKWGNARTIWMEKKGLYVKPETERMGNGHLFEPIIEQRYLEHMRKEHMLEITPVSRNIFVAHPSLPIGGTTDFIGETQGFGGSEIGSEFKSTSWLDDWGPEGTDQIPYRVAIQCNGYMLLHELGQWDIMAMLIDRGVEFRHYTIERNDALIEKIKHTACAFWDTYMTGGEEPEDQDVEAPFEIPTLDTMQAPPTLAELMSKASMLSLQIDDQTPAATTAEYKRTIELIKANFGNARAYTHDGWIANWSRKIEQTLDKEAAYDALRAKFLAIPHDAQDARFLADLERAHTKPKTTQRFTLNKVKEKK